MTERESLYLWSPTAAANATNDPNINWAENQLPSTVNNSARSVMAGISRFLQDTNGSLSTAGSANAYTLSIFGTQTAYANGHILSFKASFTNTGPATLNVSNADATVLGAKSLRVFSAVGDSALVAGQIVSGGRYIAQYSTTANSSAGGWIVLNPNVKLGISGSIVMYPNPANAPGSAPSNQSALDGYGAPIAVSSSTTGGLAELEAVAAAVGNPMFITQWGIGTNPPSPNPQYIGTSTTWATSPRGIWSTEIINATVACVMTDGTSGIRFDSAEIGRFNLIGQLVYNSTGAGIDIKPTIITPNDHFINFSLNDFSVTTVVGGSTADAALRMNLSASGQNFGILQNVFNFKEINGGIKGIRITDSTGTNTGVINRFNHNVITALAVHGQSTAGIAVGDSTTNQQWLSGNDWTAFFSSTAAPDAFVTYERNSFIKIGINSDNTFTNGLHFKSGSINNVAVLLDMDGATNKVVDDNGLTTVNGNIVIGLGAITIGGYPVVKAEIGSMRQALDSISTSVGSVLVRTSATSWNSVVLGDAQILVGQTGAAPLAKTVSGDATLAASGALTVTKTGGVAFATVATSGSASDLSTGTLAAARGGAGTITGLLKGNGAGVVSAATAGTDYDTPASTSTLTNKTFDTAGTGNVFKINGTGVTAVTGTGAAVLAASPTLTGTAVMSSATVNGTLTIPNAGSFFGVNTGVGTPFFGLGFDGTAHNAMNMNETTGAVAGFSFISFRSAGTQVGSISYNGTNTLYATTSDKRLKTDARAFDGARAILSGLKVWDFAWKKDPARRGIGVFAQDAFEVWEDPVQRGTYADDAWSVDYSAYVPVLIAAAQETNKELARLKAQVAALRKQISEAKKAEAPPKE